MNNDQSQPQLPKFQRGKPLRAHELNQVVGQIVRSHAGVPSARRVPPTPLMPLIGRFVVREELDDHLSCERVPWSLATGDISNTTDRILIAKPFNLQRTPFDGETRNGFTYTYSSAYERVSEDEDGNQENQIITPPYVDRDQILAVRNILGGAGVTVNNWLLEWMQIPDDRAWMKKAV